MISSSEASDRCVRANIINGAIKIEIFIFRLTTLRITGWQWSAAELPVRVDAVVSPFR
jgi:hypothetical protein